MKGQFLVNDDYLKPILKLQESKSQILLTLKTIVEVACNHMELDLNLLARKTPIPTITNIKAINSFPLIWIFIHMLIFLIMKYRKMDTNRSIRTFFIFFISVKYDPLNLVALYLIALLLVTIFL